MKNFFYILFFVFCTSNFLLSQKTFEEFGPYNSYTYTDLKEALKSPADVYKLKLSYTTPDNKSLSKFSKLTSIQALMFNTCGLKTWPKGFESLSSLQYLSVFNCDFGSFPPELKNYGNLVYLEMFNTKLDSIPNDIGFLQKLKTLKLSTLTDTLKISKNFKYLKNLQTLWFESVVLDSMPAVVFKVEGLKELYINNCRIQALPQKLDKMSKLEALVLDNNKLSEIPRSIHKLRNLEFLSLKNNKLSKLPDTICHLKKLKTLDLSGNNFSKAQKDEIQALLFGCKIIF